VASQVSNDELAMMLRKLNILSDNIGISGNEALRNAKDVVASTRDHNLNPVFAIDAMEEGLAYVGAYHAIAFKKRLGKAPEEAAVGNETHRPPKELTVDPPPGRHADSSREEAPSATPAKSRNTTPVPSDETPLPKGPLSGTWQASTGAMFRIKDDGTTATVELVSSDLLRAFSGKLTRGDNLPNSKLLTGTLDAVFRKDAPKRYSAHFTATLSDQDHLRLRTSDWPVWNNRGKNLGKRAMTEIWTRQGSH
jgi:hypothetical protein